ncbi:hypothetical protein LY90DRAFT_514981 [Neocallimastix californiae]|uniref:Uncharacterized protein n=1 Tax=Neocallimastix californiae TaxID=1754190 RepID=A0A1Y2AM75_9FUNG|nr:hypothetical protein LY90DRAFT_514981 [Neocallimastix californiae]|eukprot:ORY23592.1 hypothetical protein LY90DRAFT_514981 [Neocallimastix californiae]
MLYLYYYKDIEDLVSMQITFNRSWKLFLIGLFQYESINRFFSMMAINSSGLIFTLNNISVSDESRVNRMMAIYLLGEISKYFGQIRSNEDLTLYTFKKISEQILYLLNKELQFYVNNKDDLYKILSEENEKKNYLINSLGKLTKYPSVFHDYIEKLSLFIIDEEMNINMKVLDEVNNILNDSKTNIKLETKKKIELVIDSCQYAIKTLLDLMNDNFYKTEDNKKVIGRIFEEYVPKIIESTDNDLSKKAIKFIGNWYPIAKSDNSKYEGLKLVKEGYKLAMDLCRNQSLERNIFKQIEEEYQDVITNINNKITIERIKNEKLKIVLRELFSIPGTYTILEGNKEYPGFFQIYNSSLLRTDSIVMFLPIHPNSKVKIIRPIPKIPGVPDNATTIPPVYSEYLLSENQLIELSLYELKEKCGLIPDLPIGFTYNSGVFKEKQKEIDGYDPEDNKLPSNTISRPTRIAKTTFPPGFLQKCPFYGFDNSKFDKSTIQSSTQSSEVVFTNSYENTLNIPKGATTENTPVIWPNKNM